MKSGYRKMRCGLIGEHLGHSFSKIIHRQIADYSYDLVELERDRVGDFVKNGGLLLVLPNTGIMDQNGQTCDSGLPGPIADVTGTHSVDYGQLPKFAEDLALESEKYPSFKVSQWMEELIPDADTEILGYYTGFTGIDKLPAFTCHRYGAGKAWHLGSYPPTAKELETFYRTFYEENGIAVNGWTDGKSFRFKRFKPDGSSIEFQITPSERKVEVIL